MAMKNLVTLSLSVKVNCEVRPFDSRDPIPKNIHQASAGDANSPPLGVQTSEIYRFIFQNMESASAVGCLGKLFISYLSGIWVLHGPTKYLISM